MESVYIHIPFCKEICSYCDFPKVLCNKNWIDKYLEELENEIKDKYAKEIINTLYIGGGTPSSLSLEQLAKLFSVLSILNVSNSAEITFECNLNDINDSLLKALKDHGVSRLSIGIQTFNEDSLKFLYRSHDFKDAESKIKLCRYYGFDNINLDLIYAIPGQTFKSLKKDLKLFLKLRPEHISTYSLIIENNTMLKINFTNPINEELDYKMYKYICKKLRKKHYNHYEVSNFAISGKESKHNLHYWNNEEYYGFGLGAHGYAFGVRYENTRSLTDYLKGKYLLNEELISKQTEMENELILGFRKLKGINMQQFYEKFDVNMQEVFPIKPLLKSKELVYKNGYIFINPDKIYVMNDILMKFV